MEVIKNANQDFENYQKAKKQVEKIKGFYSHLAFYLIFNAIIIVINLVYTPKELWFIWTTICWGIGLFSHALKVFDWFPFIGKGWEERKMQQFMDEEKRNQNKYE